VTLRHLDFPASQWRLQDITTAREVLKHVRADPGLARAWRGSVVLSFAEVEGSYPYLIPAIVGFLQKVYSEFPYLLYFLNPDPAKGALDSFCATIGALHEDQNGAGSFGPMMPQPRSSEHSPTLPNSRSTKAMIGSL
jgi:hypothetical protein